MASVAASRADAVSEGGAATADELADDAGGYRLGVRVAQRQQLEDRAVANAHTGAHEHYEEYEQLDRRQEGRADRAYEYQHIYEGEDPYAAETVGAVAADDPHGRGRKAYEYHELAS
jgi:hypothetical protein